MKMFRNPSKLRRPRLRSDIGDIFYFNEAVAKHWAEYLEEHKIPAKGFATWPTYHMAKKILEMYMLRKMTMHDMNLAKMIFEQNTVNISTNLTIADTVLDTGERILVFERLSRVLGLSKNNSL